MKEIIWIMNILWIVLLYSCRDTAHTTSQSSTEIMPYRIPEIDISREELQDKIEGLIYGAAIGDAMGAPTEMWSRYDIEVDYGYVSELEDMVRIPSGEGIWQHNLPAGGTTDDTRWKQIMGEFILSQEKGFYTESGPDPKTFAAFIVNQYQKQVQNLKDTNGFDPIPFEESARKMAWLQEWGIVAKPFAEGNHQEYQHALHRFYGGEMTCAGMLYSPMIGLMFPQNPEKAYQAAYELAIFDIGYARDLTALVSALVANSFDKNIPPDSLLKVISQVDPQNYFSSRLVNRTAYRIYRESKFMVYEAKNRDITLLDKPKKLPTNFPKNDTTEYARIQYLYKLLDTKNQDMPFHPGEIFRVCLVGMMYNDFDFERSLSFIINFGRDNDTSGAVAGAILGAYWGANQLPSDMIGQIKKVNQEILHIDLDNLITELVNMMQPAKS